jgi:hypothetical protein
MVDDFSAGWQGTGLDIIREEEPGDCRGGAWPLSPGKPMQPVIADVLAVRGLPLRVSVANGRPRETSDPNAVGATAGS